MNRRQTASANTIISDRWGIRRLGWSCYFLQADECIFLILEGFDRDMESNTAHFDAAWLKVVFFFWRVAISRHEKCLVQAWRFVFGHEVAMKEFETINLTAPWWSLAALCIRRRRAKYILLLDLFT